MCVCVCVRRKNRDENKNRSVKNIHRSRWRDSRLRVVWLLLFVRMMWSDFGLSLTNLPVWALSSWTSISRYVCLSHTTSLHFPMLFALNHREKVLYLTCYSKSIPFVTNHSPPQTPLSSLLSLHWEGDGTKARGHTASGHLMDLSTSILLQTWL